MIAATIDPSLLNLDSALCESITSISQPILWPHSSHTTCRSQVSSHLRIAHAQSMPFVCLKFHAPFPEDD